MQFTQLTTISGLTLAHVSAGHTAGTGTLTAATADTVTWQEPGASAAGAAVEIANGETKIVAGEDTDLYIVVSRTSATDLSGSSLVSILDVKSTADRLAEVDAAISVCLNAQSESVEGAAIQRAQLATLWTMRKELEDKAAREDGSRAHVASADLRGNFQ